MHELKTMHLFAGIGGGLLADLILGHKPVCAVEWEPYACKVLRERAADGWFPGLSVWEGDVRMFDPSEYTGIVDCIHAGFPCQPFSVAGLRKGSQDERGELFSEVIRCVEAIRPKQIFLENVPGLTTSKSPSCVCGWPYRRGGLYQDSSPVETDNINIHRNCSDEYVQQGASSRGANERTVWGESLRGSFSEREVVGSMAVAYQRGYSKQIREGNSPILNAETTTGRFDSVSQRAKGVATDSEKWDESMVTGCEGEGGIDEGEDAPIEQEGAKCPNCSRGLVSAEPGLVWYMESICGTLAALGYDCRWICIRASDVGAPHHRDRWFLLVDSNGINSGNEREKKMQGNRIVDQWEAKHVHDGITEYVADTDSAQRQGNERTKRIGAQHSNISSSSGRPVKPELGELAYGFSAGFCGYWEQEPDIGRVATSVKNRVGQLNGYGNAQVPLQAATAYRLLGGL